MQAHAVGRRWGRRHAAVGLGISVGVASVGAPGSRSRPQPASGLEPELPVQRRRAATPAGSQPCRAHRRLPVSHQTRQRNHSNAPPHFDWQSLSNPPGDATTHLSLPDYAVDGVPKKKGSRGPTVIEVKTADEVRAEKQRSDESLMLALGTGGRSHYTG